jgi:hypothetical protein
MLLDCLSDAQFYGLMLLFLALALTVAAAVICCPLDVDGVSDREKHR